MELLSRLNWVDLAIILILAGGVFVGFTQGMIRYVLNAIAVLVAFVLAAQLKGPILDLLRFWTAFTPEGRELLVFVLLFFGFVIAAWFAIRALYRRTRLPVAKQLDELGGAIFGLIFAALVISFQLVVYDSFFRGGGETGGWVASYYDALNSSLIVAFFRETVIPTAGFLARPFVPDEIALLLFP
ncbi:MAG TPA: CvpA family protein [Candidatus Limnocylindria bacterium]|nr:CvpA family protein [Candidatus Limnocylindria bacterium]